MSEQIAFTGRLEGSSAKGESGWNLYVNGNLVGQKEWRVDLLAWSPDSQLAICTFLKMSLTLSHLPLLYAIAADFSARRFERGKDASALERLELTYVLYHHLDVSINWLAIHRVEQRYAGQ